MSDESLMQGYDVVVCDTCGFIYADCIPEQTIFDTYYRNMSKYENEESNDQCELQRFRDIVDMLIPFFPDRNIRLLDIGCATGRLLAIFQESGYLNVLGLDPSRKCSIIARKLHNIRVSTGSLSNIDEVLKSEKPFDCIMLIGVLEHIKGVELALFKVINLLPLGGFVFIEVPDASRFSSIEDAPFQQFSTEHINFFSPISLDNLMQKYGFDRIFHKQKNRNQSSNTFMPVISAFYRKIDNLKILKPIYDKETEQDIILYIQQSRKVEERINHIIDKLVENSKPLIVWGVGTHTLRLLSTSRLSKANIVFFVDSNSLYHGKTISGIPIISPYQLREHNEAILISSQIFQSSIQEQIRKKLNLKNEIIKLY